MARLVISDPGGFAVAVDVRSGAEIGRDSDCDVVLSDAKVSRRHVTFESDGADWWVIDRGSRHGTYLNGAPIDKARIRNGDQLQLGETAVTFVDADVVSHVISRTTAGSPESGRSDRLQVLYGLARAAQSIDDLEAVLSRTLESVVGAVGGDRGLLAVALEPGARPRRIADVGASASEVVISRAVVEATQRGESILVRERDGKVLAGTLGAQGIRSALAAPIAVSGAQLGFIYIDSLGDSEALGDADLELVAAVGVFAGAIADAAARYRQAEAVAEVARSRPAPAILGSSPAILAVRRDIDRLGPTEIAVHISGESGVGKELVARALCAASARQAGPLVTLNCAAIPENLIESELFGHTRGAFTGAAQARRGKFALADGGTLFLDEVADLSAAAQAKMLRVIEDGEIQPIGAERSSTVDVRVLSASHKPLAREVAAGRFREDLYYRLVVAEIPVPPLRQRRGDIAALAETFLSAAGHKGARGARFSAAALAALGDHTWPGNIRELRNVVERAAALATRETIEVSDLRLDPSPSRPLATAGGSLAEQFAALEVTERELVAAALEATGGNVSEAGRLLGISRVMVKRRIDRFDI